MSERKQDLNTRDSAGASQARRPGAIDWRQVRALVDLHLKQNLRPGRHSTTGAKIHPIRQLIVSMGMLGLFFIGNVRSCADLSSFLILLFSVMFAMAIFSAMPEALDARRRNVEVLASKPVDSRTSLTARTVTLFYTIGIITTCFTILPLISTRWFFAASWLLIAGSYLMIAIGCFSVVILSLTAIIYSARWFNIDKIRGFAQIIFLFVSLGMMGISVVSAGGITARAAAGSISLASSGVVRFLPSAWFATFFSGKMDLAANLERAAAGFLTMLAVAIALRLDIGRRYPDLIERLLSPDERPAKAPQTLRLMELIRGIPLLGKIAVPEQTRAVGAMVITLTGREVVSRLSSLAPMVLLIAFFAIGIFSGDQTVSPVLIGFYGYMNLIMGCDLVKQNPQSEASWVFYCAPIEGNNLIKGMRLVVGLRYFLLPALLVTITMFVKHEPLLAGLLSLGYLVMAHGIVALSLILKPAMPLSLEQQPSQTMLGFALTLGISLVSAFGYALIVIAADKLGVYGSMLGAAGIGCLFLIGYGLVRVAAGRIAKLEFTR